MYKSVLILLIYCYTYSFCVAETKPKYPIEVEKVLAQSGNNRIELEKAISYYSKTVSDSLKLKACYFLIQNMDIHYSANYYWANTKGENVNFNELNYSNFETSLKAFKQLKDSIKIRPIPYSYRDMDSIKSSFLIETIERAFEVWKNPFDKNLSFDNFCEYILPYRISVEPLENWRKTYFDKFAWITDSAQKCNVNAIDILNFNLATWFKNTYGIESRSEPLPRLSPSQLLFRKQGECEDMVNLTCVALRSQGIPCVVDLVTYWGTSSGSHFWCVSIDSTKMLPFEAVSFKSINEFKIPREPAKVMRLTFAKNPNALASNVNAKSIPNGILQMKNTKDVTNLYWPVTDLKCRLYETKIAQPIVFLCVFNYSSWRPVWWSNVSKNEAVFTNMAKGCVYLPMYYLNQKLIVAGNPVALGYKSEFEIIPDEISLHTIILKEQDKYLRFQIGKKYKLFYWNKKWIQIDEKIADYTLELQFDKVPQNALLLLVPEYSQQKERPFLMKNNLERIWL